MWRLRLSLLEAEAGRAACQGYIVGRPCPPKPKLKPTAARQVNYSTHMRVRVRHKSTSAVSELVTFQNCNRKKPEKEINLELQVVFYGHFK